MAALQHVNTPGYAALLLRRTFADLALPGALMDRADAWLRGGAARWDDTEHTWHFPSGASITFGYLETEKSKYRYQSAEFQFVGFDELTQFSESQYLYLFSRLRRLTGSDIPIRMRAASNPGGSGHDWVKGRFIDPHGDAERVFIPARLHENPFVDQGAYLESLEQLDDVTRQQLLDGNWDVLPTGNYFGRFDRERNIAKVKVINNWRTDRCVDFGFRHPAALWIQVSPAGQPFVVREHLPTNVTTKEFAAGCVEVDRSLGKFAVPIGHTYCDPAGKAVNVQTAQSEFESFRDAGLSPVGVSSSIRDGCVLMTSAIVDEHLPLVISEACPQLIRAITRVEPHKSRPEVYDYDHAIYSHPLDALRYWFVNNRRPTSPYTPPKPGRTVTGGLKTHTY